MKEHRLLRGHVGLMVLLNFASHVATRNPELRARMEDFQTRMYETIGDMIVSSREMYEGQLRQMRKAGRMDDLPNVPYEKVRDFVRGREYDIVFPAGYHIPAEFEAQDIVLRKMLARKWSLLRAPAGTEFISSDSTRMPVAGSTDEASRWLWHKQHDGPPSGYIFTASSRDVRRG